MIKIKLSHYEKNLEMITMKEELLNDIRFTGYAVQFNDVGALQIEGDHLLLNMNSSSIGCTPKMKLVGLIMLTSLISLMMF